MLFLVAKRAVSEIRVPFGQTIYGDADDGLAAAVSLVFSVTITPQPPLKGTATKGLAVSVGLVVCRAIFSRKGKAG